MKNFILYFLLFFGFDAPAAAQHNHFIFIQSENKEPFTVSLKNKSFKSTAAGYLIIPRVTSGEYEMTVSFPKLSAPESKFNFVVENKDVGFSLKQAGGAGWALTNIQTYVTIRPGENLAANNKQANPVKNATAKNSSAGALKLKKGINKIKEVQESGAVTLRFLDVQDKRTDTIDVVIPVDQPAGFGNMPGKPVALSSRMEFLQTSSPGGGNGLALLAVRQEGYNTNCVNLASGDDFYRLRKKMASETSDDKMILEAKKAARNKCYTTIQVKNLSSLFLSDLARLKFFRAMHPLVYDYLQYPTLEKELSEQAVIEKFREIVRR